MSFNKVLSVIRRNKTFLLSTHVNPDPDALCSELALAMFLRNLGKKVVIVNEALVPEHLNFLPKAEWVKALRPKLKLSFDVAMIVDCGDLDRIGKVQELLKPETFIVNIDHHVTNTYFGSVNLVNASASTTEILYELFKKSKELITDDMAYHLYAGIMTDTGSFRYENTTAKTHYIASELRKYHFSSDEIYRDIYEHIPLADLKETANIISQMEILFSGKAVCLKLYKKNLAKFSKEFDLRDTLFKFLRMIKGLEVFVILTEIDKNNTRVNFRSSSYIDVAKIALHFGGGGHKRASGCVVDKNMVVSKNLIMKEVGKVI
jgi:bifunctional oligoribonuclease and PAP phosphatase NrnA